MKDLAKGMTWREAEWLFNSSGQFSHIYSTPLESGYIFENDEERKYAILSMALAAEVAKVVILAYALMTNHFHFIVKGENGKEFFLDFRARMSSKPGLPWRERYLDILALKSRKNSFPFSPFTMK